MNKKFLVSLAIILSVIFSFSICFATNNGDGIKDAADGVRNFVGGVENTVENAAKDVYNTSKSATGSVENGMNHNTTNAKTTTGTTNNNDRYTTKRVSTGDTNVMGMTSTGWTWLIIAIAGVAIIAVVWYYSMQFTNTSHHNDNDRLD